MVCEIYQEDKRNVAIKCPFNEEFITEFKIMIPFYERAWNPLEKVWIVAGQWKEKLIDLAFEYFEEVEVE